MRINPASLEALRKSTQARKGKPLSEEHRKKLSEAKKGKRPEKLIAWNKEYYKTHPGRNKGKKLPEKQREMLAKFNRENPSRYWKGKKFSEEHRKKLSLVKLGKPSPKKGKKTGHPPWNKGKPWEEKYAENSALWKGGKCPESVLWRNRVNNRIWRKICLERDGNKCTMCESKSNIVVHHEKNWEAYPELRFDPNNGTTLCASCHAKVHWELRKRKPLSVNIVEQ